MTPASLVSRDLPPEQPLPRIPLHVVADNLRSAFNVGGLFRTLDAVGGEMIHLCGYTARPPHPRVVRAAMGADRAVAWRGWPDPRFAVEWLVAQGFHVVGLEPTSAAVHFLDYPYRLPLAVVVGNEALGISPALVRRLHGLVRIPMHGHKGSLNVVVALGIVLFAAAEACPPPQAPSPEPPPPRAPQPPSHAPWPLWRWAGPPLPHATSAFLCQVPDLPAFDAWARPDAGGVLVMARPSVPLTPGGAWEPVANASGPAGESPPRSLPADPRSWAYRAASTLWEAQTRKATARLVLDHCVFEMLQHLPADPCAVEPLLTRFLDARTFPALWTTARSLTDLFLSPVGGPWRAEEVVSHPPWPALPPSAAAVVERVLGFSTPSPPSPPPPCANPPA